MTKVVEETELRSELEAVASRCGCELLHLSFAGGRLQLVLDRSEGVTIDDCARVAREASTILDVLDFGSSRYTLEVTSPGLDRQFYRSQDYDRFTGSQVKITWSDPNTSARRTEIGVLEAYRPEDGFKGAIDIMTGNDRLTIDLADVITTRLEPVI